MSNLMHTLHQDCDPAGRVAADRADERARALAHYSAEAAKAEDATPHGLILAKLTELLELVEAAVTWADSDDCETALRQAKTYWECTHATTPEQRDADAREHFDSMFPRFPRVRR